MWLGSDNNKGQPTDYSQGIRALAHCLEKETLGDRKFRVVLDDVYMLPRTIEKLELLQASPETYARALSGASIIGLNNYSAQVVQLLTEEEFATITAVIARLLPEARDPLFDRVPPARSIELVARQGTTSMNPQPENDADVLPDDDPILQRVIQLIVDDQMGGALLIGAPGTGKSWYARQIARKLTNGDVARSREVQFHPSYQYEDFVEGYVPDPKEGFRLADKHLLEMAELAKKTTDPVVLVIDEFSRTDPARVLGECMTYMDGSLRGAEFYLPSGRKASIPQNLYFIATMNPDDRSVDEIDSAMDRRWGKVAIEPDINKVRDFLAANHVPEPTRGPILEFFAALQKHVPIGHAFFRRVCDRESLSRLWETQLRFLVTKRFRFDADTLADVEALWQECVAAYDAAAAPAQQDQPAGPAQEESAPAPEANAPEQAEPAV